MTRPTHDSQIDRAHSATNTTEPPSGTPIARADALRSVLYVAVGRPGGAIPPRACPTPLTVPRSTSATISTAAGRLSSRALVGLGLAGCFVAAFSLRTLLQPAPSSLGDLDLSWQLSLGVALASHLQFGTQYLFSYGPLGFLHVSMDYPSKVLTAVAAVVTVVGQVAYGTSLMALAESERRRLHLDRRAGMALLLGTLVMASLTAATVNLGTISELLALAALALCLARPRTLTTAYVLPVVAGGLLAVGGLFKSDLLAVALAELAVLAVLGVFARGRYLRLAGITAASSVVIFVVIWIASGQSLSTLPSFLRGAWELSIGYSSALSLASHWAPAAGGALLMVALISLPLVLRPNWRTAPRPQEALILLSLPFIFVSWKDALVRMNGLYDGRALALFGALAAVAWLVLMLTPILPASRFAGGPLLACALGLVGVAFILLHLNYRPWVLTLINSHSAPASAQPASYTIPPSVVRSLRGHTTNVLPWDIAFVINHYLRWDPLPEPQTYTAYTPYLDHLDAAQLSSSAGAQRLLVSVIDIDGRYLFWDPPAVWDTVLSRYRCTATTGISAVLARRPPRIGPSHLVASGPATFGQWFTIPPTSSPYEFLHL